MGEKFSSFFSAISNSYRIKKENEILELKIQDLEREIALLKELAKENEMLRKALDVGLEKEFKLILANVIGKEPLPLFFRIDKGEKEGVKKGMPVINEAKALCGRVFETFDKFSEIQTPNEKNFFFTVKISDLNGIFSAKGLGNSKILIEFIPKEAEINIGDLVYTSAEGGFFPKGLLVGKIEKIEKSDLEPFQKAQVNLSCRIEKTESVFIIKEW